MQYAEYSCKKMASSGGKPLAVGHISGFQIDPKLVIKYQLYITPVTTYVLDDFYREN